MLCNPLDSRRSVRPTLTQVYSSETSLLDLWRAISKKLLKKREKYGVVISMEPSTEGDTIFYPHCLFVAVCLFVAFVVVICLFVNSFSKIKT